MLIWSKNKDKNKDFDFINIAKANLNKSFTFLVKSGRNNTEGIWTYERKKQLLL